MQDQKLFSTCKQTNQGFLAGWGKKPVESEMRWRIMTSVTPVTNKIFWKELPPPQPDLFPYFASKYLLMFTPKHLSAPIQVSNLPVSECGNFKSTIVDYPACTKITHITLVCNMNTGQVEALLLDQSWVMAFLMFLSLILDRQISITASLPGSQVNVMNHRQVAWRNLWLQGNVNTNCLGRAFCILVGNFKPPWFGRILPYLDSKNHPYSQSLPKLPHAFSASGFHGTWVISNLDQSAQNPKSQIWWSMKSG